LLTVRRLSSASRFNSRNSLGVIRTRSEIERAAPSFSGFLTVGTRG